MCVENTFSAPKCPARPLPKAEGKRERKVGRLPSPSPHRRSSARRPPGPGSLEEPLRRPGVGWAWGPSSATPAACGPPPSPARDWLGGRVCPPRRGGEGPLRAPGGRRRRRRRGRRERGPGGSERGGGRAGRRRSESRLGAERGGERRASGEEGREARAGGRESPAGSAAPPRAGRGAGAAGRCTARSRGRQPARPRSHPGGSGAGSGGGARARAPSPAGARRLPRRDARRAGCGAGRTRRRREDPAARAAAQPPGSASDPARGAGSMATGLGEPVYGLSEDEVSGSPSSPDSPGSSCPAPAGGEDPWGARPGACRGTPNSGAPGAGSRGRGCWGPPAGRRRPPSPQPSPLFVNKAAQRPSSGEFSAAPSLWVGAGRVRVPILSKPRPPGLLGNFPLRPCSPGVHDVCHVWVAAGHPRSPGKPGGRGGT